MARTKVVKNLQGWKTKFHKIVGTKKVFKPKKQNKCKCLLPLFFRNHLIQDLFRILEGLFEVKVQLRSQPNQIKT